MFIAYFPFQLVLAVQFVYLKKIFGVGFRQNFVLLAVQSLIGFSALGVYGILTMIYLFIANEYVNWVLIFAMFIFLPFCVLPHLFSSTVLNLKKFQNAETTAIARKTIDQTSSARFILTNLILMTLFMGFSSIRYYLISENTVPDLRFDSAFVLPLFVGLSRIVPVAPAGIGINEAAAELGAKIIGLEEGTGMALALLDRAILLSWKIPLGLIAVFLIYRKLVSQADKDELQINDGER